MLWPIIRVHEEKALIFYSSVAAYMLKVATALKVFDLNLINFIFLARALQLVAEEVRAECQ
jgi:hypothetical protein